MIGALPKRLLNALLRFLSRDSAGTTIATLVALFGSALTLAGVARRTTFSVVVGGLSLAAALPLALGAARARARIVRTRLEYPPPGTMVDVGGYRMHVLAEGNANGKPPIVWMTGAHMSGLGFVHLHRAIRNEMRSILIDRPGAGWSDAGPFPRTTAREAEEVARALERAGETSPFIFAGHSFGGLLVANIARRHPELVAALILLDATPPDTIVYGPDLGAGRMSRDAATMALQQMFGIVRDPDAQARKKPQYAKLFVLIDEQLGEEGKAMRAIETSARPYWANASIFEELSNTGLARAAWTTVVYDGALDGLPVYLVAPGEVNAELDVRPESASPDGARLRTFLTRSRERYLATSNRSKRIVAPAGTGHNFPAEKPEFVIDVVRMVVAETAPSQSSLEALSS